MGGGGGGCPFWFYETTDVFFGTLADINGQTLWEFFAKDFDTVFSAHNDHGSMKHVKSRFQKNYEKFWLPSSPKSYIEG